MTYIKEITIKDFRLLKEVSFKPAKYINLISGKNGTGKSTILGMIAQGFSFNHSVVDFISEEVKSLTKANAKNLDKNDSLLLEYNSLLTYFGNEFESQSNEHFKLSEKDVRQVEHVNVVLDNGTSFKIETTGHQKKLPRFVTRRDDGKSSNYVHPVIYLGLERLTPLVRTNNKEFIVDLSEQDILEIHNLYESILLKKYHREISATQTSNHKKTASFFDKKDRTIEMISSGEDNIGQFLLAIFSFKKLKDNFPNDYNGGILLIDEIDATLYPAAQNQLLDRLLEKARALHIQIFATSHSLTLLEHLEAQKLSNGRINSDIKIFTTENSISDNENIQLLELDYLYKFKNHLLVQANQQLLQDKVKVYFEDAEACYVFESLIAYEKDSNNSSLNKRLSLLKNFGLSSTNYLSLSKNKIPEFSSLSIICLDGDQNIDKLRNKNFITLPNSGTSVNPEEFIFDILDDPNSNYWKNTTNYNHSIFMKNSRYPVIKSIKQGNYDTAYKNVPGTYYNTPPRQVWKKWFEEESKHWKNRNNPVKYWKKENQELTQKFLEELEKAFNFVAKNNKIPKL